jgi:hypothetical protein
LGKLPPRYSFALNPYQEIRLSKCPVCDESTRLRKFALFIYIDGFGPMALGKTCRFCTRCELIIAHQDELEHELTIALESRAPAVIGNDYVVLGTMDRKVWRRGLGDTPTVPADIFDHIADFKKELELEYDPGGWYPDPGQG